MVVTTSRQPGQRPETIRTRLARFMPKGAVAAWSTAWSAQFERAAEIGSEDELAAAEHLGCYGGAVAHALARAEVAPSRLRVTAQAAAAMEGSLQPITLEVRAAIPGEGIDRTIFESIVRRAEPVCPVWKSLATEGRVRLVAVLDDLATPESTPAQAPAARASAAVPAAAPMPRVGGSSPLARLFATAGLPQWFTPRFAGLLGVAVFVLTAQHLLLG